MCFFRQLGLIVTWCDSRRSLKLRKQEQSDWKFDPLSLCGLLLIQLCFVYRRTLSVPQEHVG